MRRDLLLHGGRTAASVLSSCGLPGRAPDMREELAAAAGGDSRAECGYSLFR